MQQRSQRDGLRRISELLPMAIISATEALHFRHVRPPVRACTPRRMHSAIDFCGSVSVESSASVTERRKASRVCSRAGFHEVRRRQFVVIDGSASQSGISMSAMSAMAAAAAACLRRLHGIPTPRWSRRITLRGSGRGLVAVYQGHSPPSDTCSSKITIGNIWPPYFTLTITQP